MDADSFDHERLGVYRLSIIYVARSVETTQPLEELHRKARDPSLKAVLVGLGT
jgi:hypothetical protein